MSKKYAGRNQWWAIEKNGFMYPFTVFSTRSGAINKFMKSIRGDWSWSHCYRRGYRAVKIEINKIDNWN